MRNHALNRIVRFAGIGGSEYGGYAAPAQDHWLKIQRTVRAMVMPVASPDDNPPEAWT
ncbi:hypothetical protein D3C80_2202370 [compost metagenome]